VESPEQAAKYDYLRVENVHKDCEADSQPPAYIVDGVQRLWDARGNFFEYDIHLALAATGPVAGAQQQRTLADLRLPAAVGAATAGNPVGVDGHVAYLAAVARKPCQRPAIDDHSAADAHFTGEVDYVLGLNRGTAPVLGQDGHIGFVCDRQRDGRVEGVRQLRAEWDFIPAEVWRDRA